jgi:hypothetical protein
MHTLILTSLYILVLNLLYIDINSLAFVIHGDELDRFLSPDVKLLIHVLLIDSRIIRTWHHCTTSLKPSQQATNSVSSTDWQPKNNHQHPSCGSSRQQNLYLSIKLGSTFSFNQPRLGAFQVGTGRDALAISFVAIFLAFFDTLMISGGWAR